MTNIEKKITGPAGGRLEAEARQRHPGPHAAAGSRRRGAAAALRRELRAGAGAEGRDAAEGHPVAFHRRSAVG